MKSQAAKLSKRQEEVVREELDKYPYNRRIKYVEPYFTPVDLSNSNPHFTAAITDAGACHVYNGNSLHSTYQESTRTAQLHNSFDPRTKKIRPAMINGTGNIYKMIMWLDAGNKYRESVNYFTKKKGDIMISINEWISYYNVRINNLQFHAGTEVRIRVKPIKHTTSSNFRGMSIEKRGCQFTDEIKAMICCNIVIIEY